MKSISIHRDLRIWTLADSAIHYKTDSTDLTDNQPHINSEHVEDKPDHPDDHLDHSNNHHDHPDYLPDPETNPTILIIILTIRNGLNPPPSKKTHTKNTTTLYTNPTFLTFSNFCINEI